MKRYYMIGVTVAVFVFATGIGTAFAGASMAQLRGDEFNCYLFFSLPDGKYAQFMINGSSEYDVLSKSLEAFHKYVEEEGAQLEAAEGNIPDSFCAPSYQWCLDDEPSFLPADSLLLTKYPYQYYETMINQVQDLSLYLSYRFKSYVVVVVE